MAANEYVQAAAGQLQSGATALKSEADQIRADFMTYERGATHEINTKEAEIHAINAKLLREQPPETHVSLQLLARKLQSDVDSKKKEMEQQRARMNQAVSAKERAMNDLMNQARGLQSKAGSLK